MSTLQNILLAALLLGGVAAEAAAVAVTPKLVTSCSCIDTVNNGGPYMVESTITNSASCTSLGLKPTCQTRIFLAEATSYARNWTLAVPRTTTVYVTAPAAAPTTPHTIPAPDTTSLKQATTNTLSTPTSIKPAPMSTKPITTSTPSAPTSTKPAPASTKPTPTSVAPPPTSTKPTSTSTTHTTPPPPPPPKTTSTSSKSSSTPAPSPNMGYSKRGLAFNDPRLVQPFFTAGGRITWAWNWATTPYGSIKDVTTGYPKIEFVPILPADIPEAKVWLDTIRDSQHKYSTKALMHFNEPDQCGSGGTCMGIPNVVLAWKQFMQPFSGYILLGGPSVTNGDAPKGLTYLKDFLNACSGCKFDFFPIHWYGAANDAAGFKAHVAKASELVRHAPLWVTEYGTTSGSPEEIEAFVKDVSTWMDGSDMVARYSYFWDAPGFLIEKGGTNLSSLGEWYNTQ